VSGEIFPGDWAKVRISAAPATTHSQRRDSGAVDSRRDSGKSNLRSVAVLDPVEHR
jgi:hypothetical protein